MNRHIPRPGFRRPGAALALAVAAACAIAAPAAHAQDPTAPPAEVTLPAGVVARVGSEDITEDQLLDRLAQRHESTQKGKEILGQIVEDAIVAAEAARKGVSVTDDETRRYAERVVETVRKQGWGGKTIDEVLKETGTTWDEFLRTAKEYIVREKLARAAYGLEPEQEVAEVRLKQYVAELRRTAGVRYDGLEPGVLAQIGETRKIDRRAFARELRTRLPVELVAATRAELVLDAATRREVARAGVVVTEEDVDAQVRRLRERFEKNARVREAGATFDQFLRQIFGFGEDELRNDPTFRSRVGLERLLSRQIGDEDVRRHWEANRLAFGDRALLRQVFVAAGDAGANFGRELPNFREAQDQAMRAKIEILERAATAKQGPAGTSPLGDIVASVAKRFEADEAARARAGEPVAWNRNDVAGETELERKVFEGELLQVLGPVRSKLGWHVLVVEERRPAPSFEEIRTQVRDELLRVAVRNFQLRIRSDGDVVLPELR